MRTRLVRLSLILLLLVAAAPGVPSTEGAGPDLTDHCPRDPLLVYVTTVAQLSDKLDEMLGFVERFGDTAGAMDEKLAEFEQELGCSVRDDLLEPIGPDMALVVDVPPIDSLAAGMADPAQGIAQALAGIGLLGQVRDVAAFDGCLRKLFGKDGAATVSDEEGLVKIALPLEPGGPAFALYYGFAEGRFALGASTEFVRASLAPRAEGRRLGDGADFSRVVAHLDAAPEDLFYINLPKLREMMSNSMIVQSAMAQEPETQAVFDLLLSPEFSPMGLGTTSVTVNGGTRTTSYGPSTLSGGTASAGIVAAIAIPNLLNAIDRGKQKRTMADLRSIGTAIEAYAIDHNRYTGPTAGWVDVGWLAGTLSPAYIRTLPERDGWDRPIRFWSDGERYVLLSPGKDGERERDWAADAGDGGATSSFASDIVFGDGSFLQWPEGQQE